MNIVDWLALGIAFFFFASATSGMFLALKMYRVFGKKWNNLLLVGSLSFMSTTSLLIAASFTGLQVIAL